MPELVLGLALVAGTVVAARLSLPVGGKVRPWITPTIETYVPITFLSALTAAIALVTTGAVSLVAWR